MTVKSGRRDFESHQNALATSESRDEHSPEGLSCSIWHSESVPKDWLKQIVVSLLKKGEYCECNNFRCIALLTVPSHSREIEGGSELCTQRESVWFP